MSRLIVVSFENIIVVFMYTTYYVNHIIDNTLIIIFIIFRMKAIITVQ